MRVIVRRSGGVGGIRVGGEVDTAALEPELAERAERVLTAPMGPEAHPAPGSADRQRYDVVLPDAPTGSTGFAVDETSAPPEVVQVLDDLIREIVARRGRR